MGDWTDLKATGRGRIAHLLEIAGYPYCFATITGWTPSDSWYSTRGYDEVKPWLQAKGINTDESSRFIEGDLEAEGITVAIADIDGGMTAMLSDFAVRNASRLASDLTAAGTTVTVYDASVFPAAPSRAWLGLEAVDYTGKTATTLTGCTRGALGTTARAYDVDDAAEPPVGIMVTDGPTDIRGRPCRIHIAVIDPTTGDPGETEVVWRGFVGQDLDIGKGEWLVPLDHISSILSRNVAQDLPETTVWPGYWYGGTGWPGLSTVRYWVCDAAVPSGFVKDVTIDAGLYTETELRSEFNSQAIALGASAAPNLVFTGDDLAHTLSVLPDATYYVRLLIREGDPLWALGFKPGMIVQELNTGLQFPADDDPKLAVVDWSSPATATQSPRLGVDDEALFSAGTHAMVPKHAFARVASTTANTVLFRLHSQDPARHTKYWAIEKEEDMLLRGVFAIGWDRADPDTLEDTVWKLLYLYDGQDEPAEWCAFGLTSDDVAFSELTSALAGAPMELQLFYDALTEAVAVKDVIGARLGILGVAPRITTDGKLGFARIEQPTELNAESVELDAVVWSVLDAAQVRASLGGEPLITQAKITFGHDYRDDEWSEPLTITWADGIVEHGRVRAVTYQLHGLITHPSYPGMARDRSELELALAPWMTALHYQIFGRLNAPVQIPCTWLAKQDEFRSGSQIKVTHPLLPDLPEGAIGMTDRLGVVYGRQLKTTEDAPDVLRVHIPAVSRASGIAPCTLGSTWTVGTLVLSCPLAGNPQYAADGAHDFDDFTVGDDVLVWAYNTETQPAGYPLQATIADLDTATDELTFTGDPFSGAGLPASGSVWVVFHDWDGQTANQQIFLSIADDGYDLGADDDDGFQWGV